MKRLLIAVLATTTVLTAPTIAYATADRSTPPDARAAKWHKMNDQSTSGAQWSDARYRFLPAGPETRGAFNFTGTLRSTDKNNGVYLEVAVHGYAPNVFRASRGTAKRYNKNVFDGAMQRTRDVRVRVCRDRGTLIPDNCSGKEEYVR
ncbi:hypothetical protein JGS22_004325 [Streptomyces sp. P38-E01]|uniref:Secreted protein n=1 Tax=Streptomyces tardus TaxID=2780544 RepID=A0A949N3I0_9ACTN|nr:hypothetical protein [Streptomyces tardus]MBU7596884.1 hypothetical protein [Streptomyces tardus]